MTLAMFHPFDQLAAKFLDTSANDEDGAHDLSHIVRVWHNVRLIHRDEGGDLEVLAAAVLLHDCVQVAKDSSLRSKASMLAANEARVRLTALGWEPSRIETVARAIESHSFSAGVAPASIEGCILQDADRLDAIGALRDVSTPRAVWGHACMIWPILRQRHASWMMPETRWITFPESC
jgi:uncharacterized protein